MSDETQSCQGVDACLGDVARLRSNIKLLLDAVGASESKPCTGCDRPIRFIVTKNGRKAPITMDGLNHFADCPAVDRFKRRG